jgi:hypothetical protein
LENEKKANIFSRIGLYNQFTSNEYKKALENHEKSHEISKRYHKNSDHLDIARSLDNIGVTYENLGEYSKAL